MTVPSSGETFTVTRTFTAEDVERFAELSGDTQPRHTDATSGPRLVHGLLTATLPTQIGGELEVLARTMTFDFRKPVYTNERIECTWMTDAVEERADRYDIDASVVCERLDEANVGRETDASRELEPNRETVLSGSIEGVIWKSGVDESSEPVGRG